MTRGQPLFTDLNVIATHGTHLPVLMRVMEMTTGPTLEMGMGLNSSLFLHWYCATGKRELVSCEDDPVYFEWSSQFEKDFHTVHRADKWEEMPIDREWDVAFLDHAPGNRRPVDMLRLANLARYIVVHDTEGTNKYDYGFRAVWGLFKYRFDYHDYRPKTSVVSNLVNLRPLYDYFKERGANVSYTENA